MSGHCLSITTCGWLNLLLGRFKYNTLVMLLQAIIAKEVDIMYIFRAWITTKDGTKVYAKTYGKKAFRIWVGPGPEPVKKN